MAFVDGVTADTLLGFEGVAEDKDEFPTVALEKRLAQGSKVLNGDEDEVAAKKVKRKTIFGFNDSKNNDDDDSDD